MFAGTGRTALGAANGQFFKELMLLPPETRCAGVIGVESYRERIPKAEFGNEWVEDTRVFTIYKK